MSIEALDIAIGKGAGSISLGSAARRSVYNVFSNCVHAENWLAWPSIGYIEERTELDRKTILAAIKWMVEHGYLTDTGDRKGATGQVKVYRFEATPNNPVSGTVKEQYQKRNSTKNGTVPETPSNSTVFDLKESQKRDTEPLEPFMNTQAPAASAAREPEEIVSGEKADDVTTAFDEWNLVAESCSLKRAKDLTEHRRKAIAAVLKHAGLDGWSTALRQVRCSAFLRGGGKKHWRITLDWLLEPQNFTKVSEGQFSDAADDTDDSDAPAAPIVFKSPQLAEDLRAGGIDDQTISRWFRDASYDPQHQLIRVGSKFHRDYIETNLLFPLERALGKPPRIEVAV